MQKPAIEHANLPISNLFNILSKRIALAVFHSNEANSSPFLQQDNIETCTHDFG